MEVNTYFSNGSTIRTFFLAADLSDILSDGMGARRYNRGLVLLAFRMAHNVLRIKQPGFEGSWRTTMMVSGKKLMLAPVALLAGAMTFAIGYSFDRPTSFAQPTASDTAQQNAAAGSWWSDIPERSCR